MNGFQENRPRVLGTYGFGVEVPDLDVAEQYFTTFGLALRHRGDCLVFGSQGRDQDEVVVSKGPKKRLHHISFSVNPDHMDDFRAWLNDRDIEFHEDVPAGGYREGLWFKDPWGTWINLVPRFVAAPRDVGPDFASNEFGQKNRVGKVAFSLLDQSGLPLRLGHLVVFTPDFEQAEAYYLDVLGLKVTERASGRVTFLNAPAGESWDHHCLALLANPSRGLQHSSFEVASIDQIGFCAQRMRQAGYRGGFGPGRQALGSNYFSYMLDPWGSWTEVYSDLDQLDDSWSVVEWDELPKVWGPEWDPEFWTRNREAE